MGVALFYSGTKNASSWAMRAWLALRAADFQFNEVVVDIRRPQRFGGLAHLATLGPSATVPALVVDGVALFDSLAIMEFANDLSNGRLLPQDLLQRGVARSIVAWQHAGLSQICSRISFESSFYPFKRQLTPSEKSECCRLFEFLESVLAESGGPYLFGKVSLADFSLAPAAIRLSRHQAPLESFPLTRKWTAELIAYPSVQEWLREADELPHIWFDNYLPPETHWRDAFDVSHMAAQLFQTESAGRK